MSELWKLLFKACRHSRKSNINRDWQKAFPIIPLFFMSILEKVNGAVAIASIFFLFGVIAGTGWVDADWYGGVHLWYSAEDFRAVWAKLPVFSTACFALWVLSVVILGLNIFLKKKPENDGFIYGCCSIVFAYGMAPLLLYSQISESLVIAGCGAGVLIADGAIVLAVEYIVFWLISLTAKKQ